MGVMAFFFLVLFLVAAGAAVTWAIGYFAPNAPGIIIKIVWGVIVLIILYTLFTAVFGGHDIKIPHM